MKQFVIICSLFRWRISRWIRLMPFNMLCKLECLKLFGNSECDLINIWTFPIDKKFGIFFLEIWKFSWRFTGTVPRFVPMFFFSWIENFENTENHRMISKKNQLINDNYSISDEKYSEKNYCFPTLAQPLVRSKVCTKVGNSEKF